MVTITPIPAFNDNYIWLLQRGQEAIVVDPSDAKPVLHYLKQHELALRAILITHHHADHQGGIEGLLSAAREKCLPLSIYGPAIESITGLTHPLSGGEYLQLPWLDEGANKESHVRVLATPGHTRGHISYYLAHLDALFCGDTLFGAGCGRLFEGTHEQLKNSLDRLAALPDKTRVYCAHEYTAANLRFAKAADTDNSAIDERMHMVEIIRQQLKPSVPSTIEEEKKTNPFLRCETPGIIRTIESRQGNSQPLDPLVVFTALREWKNVF